MTDKPTDQDKRRLQEAEALRKNLARRKQQQRARATLPSTEDQPPATQPEDNRWA